MNDDIGVKPRDTGDNPLTMSVDRLRHQGVIMLAIECAEPMPTVMLPANLYSSCGKLAVEIRTLGDDRATIIAAECPPAGSFAFLVRNGIKVPAVVAWTSGDVVGLSFEEPMDGDRREQTFRGRH
ncbi:hypothetical protein [Sphingomonas oryzagri]